MKPGTLQQEKSGIFILCEIYGKADFNSCALFLKNHGVLVDVFVVVL